MAKKLESLPEFKEGSSSVLLYHDMSYHPYIRNLGVCKNCGIPETFAYVQVDKEIFYKHCKKTSIRLAKIRGTFNPEYKEK